MHKWLISGAAIALSLTVPVVAKPVVHPSADVASAVASRDRTPDNAKLDPSRKPAQLLAYLGLRKDMQVLDPFGGNLYWAEIIAPAVGQKGHVTIWQPAQFVKDEDRKKLDGFAAAHLNVSWLSSPFESPNLPKASYDFALINLDYHDVYWVSDKYKIPRMEPAAWLAVLYAAMKPGAIVGVVDHVAAAGTDPRAMVEKYHRIDPAVVRRDFRKAGFVLIGTSPMYRNPADKHDVLVFDPAIRGKTDRFVMKFKKVGR